TQPKTGTERAGNHPPESVLLLARDGGVGDQLGRDRLHQRARCRLRAMHITTRRDPRHIEDLGPRRRPASICPAALTYPPPPSVSRQISPAGARPFPAASPRAGRVRPAPAAPSRPALRAWPVW